MSKRQSYLLTILLALIIALPIKSLAGDIDEASIRKNLPDLLGANNVGKEFYFSVPPCFEDESYGYDNFIKIFVTSAVKTLVKLEIPGIPYYKSSMSIPNDVICFDLKPADASPFTKSGRENEYPEQVWTGRGIHITADFPLVVYCIIRYRATSDGFLALPVSSLGKEYIAAPYNTDPMFRAIWNYKLPSMSGVTAAYNDTKVKFIVGGNYASETAGGKKPGQSIDVTMQAGDVLMVSSRGDMGDLAGSKIIATKPVSVVSGNQCNNIPAGNQWCDYCVEQDMPTFAWGKDYHVCSIPVPKRKWPSLIRIFAKEPNTNVFRDGKQVLTLKQAGGIIGDAYMEMRVTPMDQTQRPVVYSGNKPINVVLYNTGVAEDGYPLPNSDPFWMAMTPIQQYQKEITFCTPAVQGGLRFSENYLNLVYEMDENLMMPPDMEFAQVFGGQFEWIPIRTKFQSIDPEFTYDLNGKHYAQKTITLNDDGVYKIRASRPFAAYSFGYDWCDSYGYPTSAALADLEKPDTVCPDPKWNLKCDGTTEFATITDKPDDAEIRSNLAMIVFYDDSSYNYDFEYKDFIPGETVTTTWKLTVRDVSKDAKAVISFMDRVGNDTTIKIYYYAPDVSILPENYDYGRFKLGEQGEQEFRVVNNSDKGPFVVNKLEYLFKDQHFETVICPTLPYIIPPKGEMKFTVRFYAVEEGAFRDSIGVGDTCVFFYKAQVKARVGNPVILVGDQANLAIDVDFGNVNVGDKGEAQVRVHNKGTASLIVTGYSEFNNPTVFSHNILSLRDISPSNPLELLPNGTPFEFTVYFNPISDIPYNDQIVFFSDAKEIDSIAPIVGTGVLAQLKANGYNWGRKRIDRPGTFPIAAYPVDVAAGTVIRLENQGTADVHVDSVIIDESINPEAFEINGVPFNKNIFVDFPVHAKSFKDFVVKFHPTMVGEHKLVLRYINDVGADAKTILEGIGILPQIQTTDMDFDTTIIDDMADIKNRTISITNTAYQWDDSVTISDLTILPTGIEIEPAGLPVDFGTEGFKFDKASLGLPIVLQPGESLDIPAKFVAKHIDMHNAAIKTVSDAQTDVTSNWTGFGLSQGVSTTGSSADICTGATADLPCTISNTGTSVLRIDDLQIDPQNPYASLFTIKLPAGVTVPFTIPGNSSQDLIVTFTPGQQVVNATVDLVVYNNTKKQAVVKQSLTGVSRHFKGDFTPVLTMGTNKNLKEVTIGDEFYYQMSFAPTGDVAMAQVKDVVIKFSYKKDFLAVDLNKINLGPQFQFFQKTATAKEIDAVNNIEQVTITLHSDTQILNMSGDFLSIGFHVFMPWADITKSEKAVIDSSATITMDEQTATGNLCFDLYGGDVSVNLRPICVTNLRIIALNPNYNYMLYDISPNPVSANGADVRFTLGLEAYTEVKVYNTSGELESILAADRMKPGEYSVPLPIDQLSSGVYMLKLKSGPFEESKKLVIAK